MIYCTDVAKIDRIHTSCDILDRIHHMWKIRPYFSHLYSRKISHVKYPTEYIKREAFNRILHRCEQLDLIRHSYDIVDRIHHMWIIRPNFSHLYYTAVEKSTLFVQIVTYWTENVTCENPTEFLTPLFNANVSPVWHLTKYSTRE